jgi:hypothetical protein
MEGERVRGHLTDLQKCVSHSHFASWIRELTPSTPYRLTDNEHVGGAKMYHALNEDSRVSTYVGDAITLVTTGPGNKSSLTQTHASTYDRSLSD